MLPNKKGKEENERRKMGRKESMKGKRKREKEKH